MATTGNGKAQTSGTQPSIASDEPDGAPTLEEVLRSVDQVLDANRQLDPESLALIRAAVRVDVPEAIAKKRTQDFWRRFVRGHGLRAAERLTNISRFRILLVIGGLEDSMGVYNCLQQAVGRAIELDEEAKRP